MWYNDAWSPHHPPVYVQVQKIRKLLESDHGAGAIKVGSVEEFQGQERKVSCEL